MWQFFPTYPTAEAWENRLFKTNCIRTEMLNNIRALKFNVRGYIYFRDPAKHWLFFGHVLELQEHLKHFKDAELAEIRLTGLGFWRPVTPTADLIAAYNKAWAEHIAIHGQPGAATT